MNTYVFILIAIIVLGIPSIILVYRFPKIRFVFQLIFAVLIVLFGYLLYRNINRPIKFEKELEIRRTAAIQRLKDVRTIQVSFKDKYGKYTGSFDTLINFVKNDSIEISKFIETGPWNQDEMTKEEALKKGILKKIPAYIMASDSLWNNPTYPIERIRYIPFSGDVEFTIGSGELETASKVKVQLFECYAKYSDLLKGMDKQLVVNYIDERTKYGGFEGLKVGSLEEATNNAGNWEK
ncbi:MAG: hypothetical protein JXB34_13370 [Bacteroidales bacterium]|nr:hypothetical protein [Bacteroidales bacterium]